jgi:spermidine/putrescine transport system substrate-binding protein
MKLIKKSLIFLFCFILAFGCFAVCASADEDEYFTEEQIEYYKNLGLQGTSVNVYNWGDYISDGSEGSMDVVAEFERLTGAKVNYTNFESTRICIQSSLAARFVRRYYSLRLYDSAPD